MANHENKTYENDTDKWVAGRLAALVPPEGWSPGAIGALAQLRNRSRARRVAVRRWLVGAATASLASGALFVIPATRACAQEPIPCAKHAIESVFAEEATPPPVTPIQATHEEPAAPPSPPVLARSAKPAVPAKAGTSARPEQRSYKETGSPLAPIGVEIFADYECPPCASFFHNVVPLLAEQYVQTGKVKLLHRDFPLPSHRFAQLAARYADAAGERGYFAVVSKQIFETQPSWKVTGDVDTEVAKVLPAEVMQIVRKLVKSDAALDESLASDLTQARVDQLNQTPSLVIVYKGKRQVIAGSTSFELLKSYLDGLEK